MCAAGTVEWGEFVNAVNCLEVGSNTEKLQFLFRIYDAVSSRTRQVARE